MKLSMGHFRAFIETNELEFLTFSNIIRYAIKASYGVHLGLFLREVLLETSEKWDWLTDCKYEFSKIVKFLS